MKFLIPILLLVTTQSSNLVYQGVDNFRERLAKSIRDQVDRKLEQQFEGAFNKNMFPCNTGIKKQTNYNKYDFSKNINSECRSSNSFSIQPLIDSPSISFSTTYVNNKPKSFSSNFNDNISIPSKQAQIISSNTLRNTVIQPIKQSYMTSYSSFPFESYNSMRNDPFFSKKWYEIKPSSQTSSFYSNPALSQSYKFASPITNSNSVETIKTSLPSIQSSIPYQNYASSSFISSQNNINNQYDNFDSMKINNLIQIEPLKPILLTPLPFDNLQTTTSSYSFTPIINIQTGDHNNWSSLSSSISNNGDLLRKLIS